jgi:hypothetical protein
MEQGSENGPPRGSLLSKTQAELERDRERLQHLWAELSQTDWITRSALAACETSRKLLKKLDGS